MSKADALLTVLRTRAGITVLKNDESANQIRLVIRVPRGNETTRWLEMVRHINNLSKQAPWGIDISKQYFNANESDLRYQWRVILQGPDLAAHVAVIAQEVEGIQARPQQIEEVKLYGSSRRSKGAGYFGHVQVGPRVG